MSMSAGAAGLAPAELARARARLYTLLASALLEGLDAAGLARLRELGLAPPGCDDLDEIAAAHHDCFGLGVFAYAGVFLDARAEAGACADRVRASYGRAGFEPRGDEVAVDHLGVGLAFLASLCGASPHDALAAEFLDGCVLAYLPALIVAADRLAPAAGGLWPALLRAALELAASHRAALPGPRVAVELPTAALDPSASLRELVGWLLTPALVGVFITRADIVRLGRRHQSPRGFGSRELMLTNLLRSAGEYGELAGVFASLDASLVEADGALAELAAGHELAVAVAPWRGAISRGRALLDSLREAANGEP